MVIRALLARTSHVAVRPVSSRVRVNYICTENVSWKVQKYTCTTEIAVFQPHEPRTNFIKQSPSSKTSIHPASQDIPSPLWNLKIHYRGHMSPTLVPIHRQWKFHSEINHYSIKLWSTGIADWRTFIRYAGGNSNFFFLYMFPRPTQFSVQQLTDLLTEW